MARNKMEDYDFFSNAPDIVIDKILEKLPIYMAAQTGVLSRRWGRAWLSLKSLNFDCDFHEHKKKDWGRIDGIINRILLHHIGPIQDFLLDEAIINLGQWISFLSRNGIQKIKITSGDDDVDIPSHIFWCSELVRLELDGFNLNPPPSCFHGFSKLKHLELVNIVFTKPDIFCGLIENCRMLVTLKLVDWYDMDHVVIDAPSLQILTLNGDFKSLALRNVHSLISLTMCLMRVPKELITLGTISSIKLLASSCRLQSIRFNGCLIKFVAAGGIITSPLVKFNHLQKLCLSDLDLRDFDVFSYFLSMIECCPYIKKVDISVVPSESIGEHIIDYNYNYKLDHLLELNIEGITGSSAELKLVEYLLAISTVLENVFFKFGKCAIESELKLAKALMRIPRASTKVSLVCR